MNLARKERELARVAGLVVEEPVAAQSAPGHALHGLDGGDGVLLHRLTVAAEEVVPR